MKGILNSSRDRSRPPSSGLSSKSRSRSASRLITTPRGSWTIADSALIASGQGKGSGMFATRQTNAGEIIIEEEPLFVTKRSHNKGVPNSKLIVEGFRSLSDKQQRRYLSDYTHPKSDVQLLELAQKYANATGDYPAGRTRALEVGKVIAIFDNNTFGIQNGDDAFCSDASRINHSCNPNVVHGNDQVTGVCVVRASRNIHDGEEILISYVDVSVPKANRQSKLDRYGFICTCPACEDTAYAAESEARRVEVADLMQQVLCAETVEEAGGVSPLPPRATCMMPEQVPAALIQLLEIMELEPAMQVEKAEVAFRLGQLYVVARNVTEAKRSLEYALQLFQVVETENDDDTRECKRLLSELSM